MNRRESENRDLFAIADLAREFGISTRAIRFYETKGLLNPERVVNGGGSSQAGDLLFEPVRRTVASRAVPLQRKTAQIVAARLGDNAGVLGAAALVLDRLEGALAAI